MLDALDLLRNLRKSALVRLACGSGSGSNSSATGLKVATAAALGFCRCNLDQGDVAKEGDGERVAGTVELT